MPIETMFFDTPSKEIGLIVAIVIRDHVNRLTFAHAMPLMHPSQATRLLSHRDHIQTIVPHLTPDERELFITNMFPGSLGESEAHFTCVRCKSHNTIPIPTLHDPNRNLHTCAHCALHSMPFFIISPAQPLPTPSQFMETIQ